MLGIEDNTPRIQASTQSIDFAVTASYSKKQLKDHSMYEDIVERDLLLAYEIEGIHEEGEQYVDAFYTARSISAALESSTGVDNAARRGLTEDVLEQEDVKKTIEVMRPFVAHMGNAVAFVKRSMVRLRSSVEEMATQFAESPDSFTFYSCADGLIRAVDTIAKMDAVKDSRTCLSDDFETFSDALDTVVTRGTSRYTTLKANRDEIRLFLFPGNGDDDSDSEDSDSDSSASSN